MYLDFCIVVNELFALKLGQSVGLIHCRGKCFFGVLLQPWNIFRSSGSCAYGSCSVCELSLAYCWLAVPTFVFVNSKRHVSSGHVPARSSLPPFQSRPHQITVSARQRPGLKHPFHACACTAANVNICHAYLCMYLREIYVPRSHCCSVLCVQAAGTGTAASSLQSHRFLFKKPLWHSNSSDVAPLPHFDLRPSWSRLVIPSLRPLGKTF